MRMHFIDDFDLWEFVKEKKAEGIIRHIGISFHSTPGELETILQTHPEAEFVQLQINYADWKSRPFSPEASMRWPGSMGNGLSSWSR